MNTFSTVEIANILKVTPEWVRAQARRTLIAPTRTSRGHYRYSFQDIILLRTARHLQASDVSAHRVHEALNGLARSLPAHRSMSSMRVTLLGSTILARDSTALFEPETGQTVLDFWQPEASNVTELDRGATRAYKVREDTAASDWFELALEYENCKNVQQAEAAYQRARELDPSHINARINLGRLRHAANALEQAEALYREALAVDARHPIALFNLGVVLEDRGNVGSAIACYKLAIDADPDIAEAHYNLARLYVKQSDESEAIRHYSRYKSLTRNKDA
jgi:tetratricopeptide (TPR) repeat protein